VALRFNFAHLRETSRLNPDTADPTTAKTEGHGSQKLRPRPASTRRVSGFNLEILLHMSLLVLIHPALRGSWLILTAVFSPKTTFRSRARGSRTMRSLFVHRLAPSPSFVRQLLCFP
jgi:hypothetical protein